MGSVKIYLGYLFIVIISSACVSNQRIQSNLPSPGKQCKVLLNKKFAKINRKTKKVKEADKPKKADAVRLHANLMTNEEYMEQVAKVKKSLPEFDVEKDCPSSVKKTPVKKKFSIKSLFKR